MQKNNLLFGLIGLIFGVALGYFVTQYLNHTAVTTSNNAAPAAAQPQMPPEILGLLKRANDEPDNFAAQMQAAALYQQIGRPEKVIEFLTRAAKVKPNDADVLQALTRAWLETGNKAEAKDALKQLEKVSPKNPALAEFKKQLGS